MKQQTKWLTAALAVASGLVIASSAQAQYTTNTVSDFHNFVVSATYGNWDVAGSDPFNGGFGYTPTLSSDPTSFTVDAQGYGSLAHDFGVPLNFPGATLFQLTFTLNTTTSDQWMNPELIIKDGTHDVHLSYTGGPFLNYGNYHGPATYTLTGSLTDGLGDPIPLDTSTITGFNIGWDPAGYGNAAPYNVTYENLSLLTPVPEPATLALFGIGAVGVLIARRRTRVS